MTVDNYLDTPGPIEDAEMSEASFIDGPLSDEELTRLAMAADPDAPLSKEAIPLSLHLAQFAGAALPEWYMAPAMASNGRRWRTPIVISIIAAFLLIEALGLCNTFGQLTLA